MGGNQQLFARSPRASRNADLLRREDHHRRHLLEAGF